jgi:hypothetical protein
MALFVRAGDHAEAVEIVRLALGVGDDDISRPPLRGPLARDLKCLFRGFGGGCHLTGRAMSKSCDAVGHG